MSSFLAIQIAIWSTIMIGILTWIIGLDLIYKLGIDFKRVGIHSYFRNSGVCYTISLLLSASGIITQHIIRFITKDESIIQGEIYVSLNGFFKMLAIISSSMISVGRVYYTFKQTHYGHSKRFFKIIVSWLTASCLFLFLNLILLPLHVLPTQYETSLGIISALLLIFSSNACVGLFAAAMRKIVALSALIQEYKNHRNFVNEAKTTDKDSSNVTIIKEKYQYKIWLQDQKLLNLMARYLILGMFEHLSIMTGMLLYAGFRTHTFLWTYAIFDLLVRLVTLYILTI